MVSVTSALLFTLVLHFYLYCSDRTKRVKIVNLSVLLFKMNANLYLYKYENVCVFVCVFAFFSAIWNPIGIPFGTNVLGGLEMVLKQ